MTDTSRRPLLNPVLRFTKDPRPEGVNGRGKGKGGIITARLQKQRSLLSEQFNNMATQAMQQPQFSGRTVIYAAMFDDSLAPTWTPTDLFRTNHGARLITPYKTGYLVEVKTNQLAQYAQFVQHTERTEELVDISRVQALSFFGEANEFTPQALNELWSAGPATPNGRVFMIWLMPLKAETAAEHLIQQISNLHGNIINSLPPLLTSIKARLGQDIPTNMRHAIDQTVSDSDRINLAMREYRQKRHSRTTVVIPTHEALQKLVASGTVFRIDPLPTISTTSPGTGSEPDRPLPSEISDSPIVGVVDGGLTARSYLPAQAWCAPPFLRQNADNQHGNKVTSLIVQGHDWNNNLPLPSLYCRVGTVQAVPKKGAVSPITDVQELIAYLDTIMATHPETRVWNLSLNTQEACQIDSVSPFGHDLAVLARKRNVLLVISVGNQPGERLQPPADCEAAVTIGGRLPAADPDTTNNVCPICLSGPGPSSMLKPDISNFSHVRAIGGEIVKGSSFATALSSPLAAHTMARLKDASPDLVKALLIHSTDTMNFNPALGFGTPTIANLPWECRSGFVTLQWKAALRPGTAYYWELPIPPALRKTGKLKGSGILTAILNPHPMVTDYAGPNYFSVRLETALQFQRNSRFKNLLGSLKTGKLTEEDARIIDSKWSPVRHYKRSFRGTGFDGDTLRVYARTYARDLYLYEYTDTGQIPEMNAVFVLSIGTGDETDDIYNELRDQLGAFVETAIIETDITLENTDE